MSDQAQDSGSIREGITQLGRDFSRQSMERRLGEVAKDRPLVRHLLDLRVVGVAVAIAAALTLIVAVLISPALGAVVLVLSFFVAWYALAHRQYERRRPTRAAESED